MNYKKDLFIHCGYPKTGTTTLQRHLFPKHPEIYYWGKAVPGYSFRSAAVQKALDDLTLLPDPLFNPVPVECRNPDLISVISTESLIHPIAYDVFAVPGRLQKIFGDAKIIITIRNQAEILSSYYMNYGRYGEHFFKIGGTGNGVFMESFSAWLRSQDACRWKNLLGLLNYDLVIQAYEKVFGDVLVLVYEEFREAPENFMIKLSNFLGVDAGKSVALMSGKHENRSLSLAGRYYSKMRQLAARASIALPDIGTLSMRIFSPLFSNPATLCHQDTVLTEIIQTFAAGNTLLADKYNLPLKRFFYPMIEG
ncbi:MAG: hypothetical protein AB7E32_00480 [Desulfovibrio sp.]